jgi:hypothetical protein
MSKRNLWWLFEEDKFEEEDEFEEKDEFEEDENRKINEIITAIKSFLWELLKLEIKTIKYEGEEPVGRWDKRIKFRAKIKEKSTVLFRTPRYRFLVYPPVAFLRVSEGETPILGMYPAESVTVDYEDAEKPIEYEFYIVVFESSLDRLMEGEIYVD